MLTVLVVDDHRVVRSGIRRLVDAADGLVTVAEAGTVDESVAAARDYQPCIAIVDISLGSGCGIHAIPAISAVAPRVGIVILSMEEDPSYVMQALEAGARGYVPKSSADGELIEAIRTVANGDTYVPQAMAIRVADARAKAERRDDRTHLRRRETEVLRLLGLGYSNKEIAAALMITVRTVESHRAHLMQKTGARSRADVVRIALEFGLIER